MDPMIKVWCDTCHADHYLYEECPNGARNTYTPGGIIPVVEASGGIVPTDANPKQAYGDKKVPLALVPAAAIIGMARAFKEGARKYGPFNWRTKKVEAMTYAHAAMRHLLSFVDGEDIDPESGNEHIDHAMACLAILKDAKATGNIVDNRPEKGRCGELLRELAA